MGWFSRWRRRRILDQASLDPAVWRATLERYPFTRALDEAERTRLCELVKLFLHEKQIHGAGGMVLDDAVRLAIAVQACILVLNLGLSSYRGWVEIIVYPDEFVAEYEYVDEAGVAHSVQEPMTGESWERGPVILSWADAEEAGRGAAYNVVIHEFAHKLDMLNGEANGFPPLHADMSRERWSQAFGDAYQDFCGRVDGGDDIELDEYAAETPAEFFAVMSEAFFECPQVVRRAYAHVYEQLALFYRQDPLARRGARAYDRARARA
ncbi:MAG TPA: M90 family metallopeptidase [Burkholderiales bacterium]|nr:M90 family metallopeptidase [Burkholderiales bacterium]